MKRGKNKAIIAIIVILALIFAGAAGFIIFKLVNGAAANDRYDKIASSYASNLSETEGSQQSTGSQSTEASSKLAENPVNIAELRAQNPDIYSWIYIPETNVNYPVAQSDADDNFYLDHDIYKGYSFPGTIYSQSCNKKDYSDRVTVLYGHNMLDGSMFATLHRFSDQQFFNENRYMYVYTENRKLTYEIVSAFVYDDRHIMNSFDFTKDDVYRDFLDSVMNPHSVSSNVRDGVTLDINDRIVILSTCLNYGNGRYLVVGKLTGETPLAP